ncbi:MAG: lysophospholipid acyltransferase family protein [Lautropia sp.]
MSALLRRLFRLSLLLLLVVAGVTIELLIFPLLDDTRRRRVIRRWSAALLATCGLRLRVHDRAAGAPSALASLAALAPGRMLVANHISWLDIFAINAVATSAFVAKAELRRWPVAGLLVALAGTVFIERARRHAVHRVIGHLRERIRAGFPVAVFPEATTSDGRMLLPFYGNLLEAAIEEDTEIVPLALRYLDEHGNPAQAVTYVGDTSFVQSLWLVVGATGLVAEVHVLEPLATAGRNRHVLARELRALISSRLGLPIEGTAPETAAGSPAASR